MALMMIMKRMIKNNDHTFDRNRKYSKDILKEIVAFITSFFSLLISLITTARFI